MQDFDLKRFLIENKMTRNSQLLNEITNEQIIQYGETAPFIDTEKRLLIFDLDETLVHCFDLKES